jgi:ubiquinone/menaquinone biosynthesis C-methylase UbiE
MSLPPNLYDHDYFLSELCEGWDSYREGHGLSDLKRKEVALLELTPGMRVLDAGCGRGEVLLACADAGAEVTGLDYSEAAIAIARETLAPVAGAEVEHGDITAMPWDDESFDRALLGDVIEHLTPEQTAACLAELRRVLKPGGALVVHTSPNLNFLRVGRPIARVGLRVAGKRGTAARMDEWIEASKRYHLNEQSSGTLKRALKDAGFGEVRAWTDPDVLRLEGDGGHHLTRGLGGSRVVRAAARVLALRPFRDVFGNDVYAIARR